MCGTHMCFCVLAIRLAEPALTKVTAGAHAFVCCAVALPGWLGVGVYSSCALGTLPVQVSIV